MILKNRVLILMSLTLLTSCLQKVPAKIELKGDLKFYKGNNKYSPKVNTDAYESERQRNLYSSQEPTSNQQRAASENFAVIREGDNLYNIAQKYNTSVRDLIEANKLQPPYILKINSKLLLPNTRYHTVVEGDNLYKISRQYGMHVNKLITANNLEKPYNIIIGSKLIISNSSFTKPIKKNVETKNLASPETKAKPRKSTMAKLPNKNNRFIWPVQGKVISTFGQKAGGLYNDGINIKVEASTPVKAVEDGLVAYVGNELRGYGNLVIVKHSGGWISAYAHLKQSKVKIGTRVSQGETIALVGSTGNVDFAQLYFGIRKGREAVNPQNYLN